MADERLEIEIIADDKASGVLSKIGGIGRGVLAGGLAVAGVAFAGVGAAATYMTKAAMDSQSVAAQTAAVIQSTGGAAGMTATAIADLALNLSRMTGFDDEAIQSGENLLLTFTNIGSNIFPAATQTILDMSQALGQDLGSSAVQLGKALQDPIAGITALRRVGVNFTDAQKKMIESLIEAGDLEGAQVLILKELQTEFGGSAKAAGDTFAGQMTRAKTAIGNVAEGIGLALMPGIQKLLDKFLEFMPRIEEFAAKIGTVISTFIEFGAGSDQAKGALSALFGPEMGAQVQGILVTVSDFFGKIKDFVTGTLVPFIVEHAPAIKGILIAIGAALAAAAIVSTIMGIVGAVTALANPITLVIAVIGLLVAAWTNNWGGIQDKVKAVWAVLEPIFQVVVSWLKDKIGMAIQGLKILWETVLYPALQKVWEFIDKNIIPIFKVIAHIIGTVVEIAIKIIVIQIKVFIAILQKVWEFIQDHILPIFEKVRAFLVEKLGPVFEWLNEKIIQPLVKVFVTGLKNALDWFLGILEKIKTFLAGFKLPDWLTPGSPTPFELGLVGINKALMDMARLRLPELEFRLRAATSIYPSLSAASSMAGGYARGGGGAVRAVQIVYQPVFSTANRDELEFRLRPIIESVVRDLA